MRKFIYNFKHSRVCWLSCVFSVVLLAMHIFQYIDSNYRIEPLIRVYFYGVYPLVVFFLGINAIPFLFALFALVLEQFNDFTNYTPCLMICLFCMLNRKFKYIALVLYILDVLIVCERHDKSVIHFCIHIMNCAFIYSALYFTFEICKHKVKKLLKKLILDETDRKILAALSQGQHQKEIEGLSENTVSKRLKKCRERNFCSSNAELLLRFTAEN